MAEVRFVCLVFALMVVTIEPFEGGLWNLVKIGVLPAGTYHAMYIVYMVDITNLAMVLILYFLPFNFFILDTPLCCMNLQTIMLPSTEMIVLHYIVMALVGSFTEVRFETAKIQM